MFKLFLRLTRFKMPGAPMEQIKQNADMAKKTIDQLKEDLKCISHNYNLMLSKQLLEENAQLLKAVEEAKTDLIELEKRNGIEQITMPQSQQQEEKQEKPKKVEAKKEKKEKKPVKEQATNEESPIDVGRLDFRVGQVLTVQKHPDADSLYQLSIDCGEATPRTVCSGLVKHVAMEELQNRKVLVLCNLKPAKMRGVMSEAMVMCASTENKVEVLLPPENSKAGDLVECPGFDRKPDSIMNPKKKIFETVCPDLHTNNEMQACYKGIALKLQGNEGTFLSKTLKNVQVK